MTMHDLLIPTLCVGMPSGRSAARSQGSHLFTRRESCSRDAERPHLRRVNKWDRSEEHTSELQSHLNLVCRLLLEKKKRTLLLDLAQPREGVTLPRSCRYDGPTWSTPLGCPPSGILCGIWPHTPVPSTATQLVYG